MLTNRNAVSSEQLAANRANAAASTGPRTPEGKARSAQNARKHGFAAAVYTVPGLEEAEDLANLEQDAAAFYQPVNSQEQYAVERIALAQLALLRIERLQAALFAACLAGNVPLAEGFERSAAKSNAFSLAMRYSAQAERQYRRAVEDFDRLKALRPEEQDTLDELDQTNPRDRKALEREILSYLNAPLPPHRRFDPGQPFHAPAPPPTPSPLPDGALPHHPHSTL